MGLSNTQDNLRATFTGEPEARNKYTFFAQFAKVAELEGNQAASILFTQIAKIEKHHRERFKKLMKLVQEQTVFKRAEPIKWKCSVCGYVYEGTEPPPRCPYCKHPQEYYEPANLDV